MKKFLSLLLCLTLTIGAATFTACGDNSGDNGNMNSELPTYTVTFMQGNQKYIEMYMEEGESITDIPSPKTKKGYTVSWDKTAADLANITENITVTAIETPNEYTVSLKASENGTVTQNSFKILYDANYDLSAYAQANTGYKLVGWERNGEPFDCYGSWTLDETDVELTAIFKKVSTVHLNISVSDGDPNSLTQMTYTFEYGEEYTLPKPAHTDTDSYEFEAWRLNSVNGEVIPLSGVWKYDVEEVTLYAVFFYCYTGIY